MYKGRRVLVIGLGISGQSAVKFLMKRGALVVGTDSNQNIATTNENIRTLCQQGMVFESESNIGDVSRFDLVVVSPGIPQTNPCYRQAKEKGLEIVGEIELACREINKTCLAVTGTNGKTTVTLLTEHVLQKSGKRAKALGNIGIPLTSGVDELSKEQLDIFVIELSSFQLETLNSRFIDAGVILNITPDHLDRYPTIYEYAAAKVKMKDNIKENGELFVEDKCYIEYFSLFKNHLVKTYGYDTKCFLYTDTYDVNSQSGKAFTLPAAYHGKHSHDIENIIASYALCSTVGISAEQFIDALSSFKKPAHRIEFVRMLNDVSYIDDSKGTNIDAVIRAVDSIDGSVVLIAGGVDKGFPYTPWIQAFGPKVKSICAIGQSKEKIKNDLGHHIPTELFTTLHEAVIHAASIAKKGDTVLLSPGCSSYDMFTDYAHRGKEFQRITNAL